MILQYLDEKKNYVSLGGRVALTKAIFFSFFYFFSMYKTAVKVVLRFERLQKGENNSSYWLELGE